ncbi:hypothetical protein PIB30_065591 [Stylosanthes scabra]|uniref:Uncharacterized protein n=1 Tax=Stylosanthes scabra TaxID=79078 RepID=A0ABU6ZKV0_9FABA|nr:hypothetical protein [Stylosanthes scabra]
MAPVTIVPSRALSRAFAATVQPQGTPARSCGGLGCSRTKFGLPSRPRPPLHAPCTNRATARARTHVSRPRDRAVLLHFKTAPRLPLSLFPSSFFNLSSTPTPQKSNTHTHHHSILTFVCDLAYFALPSKFTLPPFY